MDMKLGDKVAIVTGATANIGRAIALALSTEGVRLVAVGRDHKQGGEVVRQARERGAADAIFVATDVTDLRQVKNMVTEVVNRFGTVDVLVNNAGGNTGPWGLFVDSDPDCWEADIALNMKSVLYCTHTALPHMIAQKSGRIINLGSTAGQGGDYMQSIYSTAKGGVHNFTRVLAKEVGEHNITVNCVAPYGTFPENAANDTSSGSRFHPITGSVAQDKMLQQAGLITPTGTIADDETLRRPELQNKIRRDGVLLRKFGKPAEVAAGVVYLASEVAAFVTGQVQFIDGGALL
jgi:2-hydroxycyclohexanecarboxyl-CoA dehydrogenase